MRQRVAFLVIGFCFFAGLVWQSVSLLAQEPVSDWDEPVNLSETGATTDPVLVQEPGGRLHVFWQDGFTDTYVYRQGSVRGASYSWSEPVTTTFPFTMTVPSLLADNIGRLHAFWVDSDEGSLLYSNVGVNDVTNRDAWAEPQTLAATAVDLAVALDASDVLHLVYLFPDETTAQPAGVYYQRSPDFGQSWSEADALYQSPYLRGLAADDANVQLSTTTRNGRTRLFAAWDNRARKRIFLARSENGGLSWGTPAEIAGPESGSSVVLPFDIRVGVKDDDLLLVWSNGQPEVSCALFSQSSPDLGDTWETRQPMADLLPGLTGCVRKNELLTGASLIHLLSTIENQTYLWAWDGSQWSDPVQQRPLTGFDNPVTLNAVVLGCQQTAVTPADRLLVVGCEEIAGGYNDRDIWLLSRPLGTVTEWFPSAITWVPISLIANGELPFISPQLVAAESDRLLAFWAETNRVGASPDIQVARQDADRWLLPETVLAAPEPIAGQMTAVVDPSGFLYISWGDVNGNLFLGKNTADQAHIASDWSAPTAIPLPEDVLAANPVLATDAQGVLYLAYVVAVNDGRGVYLITSTDQGQTWGAPVRVFDAATADWEKVGNVRLAVSPSGQVHLMWAHQTLLTQDGPEGKALYYARSLDGNRTFSAAVPVAEGMINWGALVITGPQTVHRLWRLWDGFEWEVMQDSSPDGGQTWIDSLPIGNLAGPLTVAANKTGDFALLQLSDTAVSEWLWRNEQWVPQPSLSFESLGDADVNGQRVAAFMTENGRLAVLFSALALDEETGAPLHGLYASDRQLNGERDNQPAAEGSIVATPSGAVSGTVVSITPPVTATVTFVPTNTLSLTPTPTAVSPLEFSNPGNGANVMVDTVLSMLPALLLILLIFSVTWLLRSRR